MKNTISILAIFVLLVAGAMLLSGCGRAKTTDEPSATNDQAATEETTGGEEAVAKPWIEVVKNGVNLVSDDNEKLALETGDELEVGDNIETDKTGLANINFPDGSVARLSSATKITVTDASYQNKSLIVRIKLSAGSLWSKILKLATPESVWEVKTSNAVAAVRGTAFGMSYLNGITTVIGSENTVIVKAIDPKTGEILENSSAEITPGKSIKISDTIVGQVTIDDGKLAGEVITAPDNIKKEEWVTNSQAADQTINNQIGALQAGGLSADAALDQYRLQMFSGSGGGSGSSGAVASTTGDNTTSSDAVDEQTLIEEDVPADGSLNLLGQTVGSDIILEDTTPTPPLTNGLTAPVGAK